ncbi:hypothetical protein JTE90_008360, partial [Oedothorax gibbosus]
CAVRRYGKTELYPGRGVYPTCGLNGKSSSKGGFSTSLVALGSNRDT